MGQLFERDDHCWKSDGNDRAVHPEYDLDPFFDEGYPNPNRNKFGDIQQDIYVSGDVECARRQKSCGRKRIGDDRIMWKCRC